MRYFTKPQVMFAVLAAIAVLLPFGGEASAAPKDPKELRQQLADLAKKHERSQDEVAGLERKSKALDRKVAATKKRIADSRDRIAQAAKTTYTTGGADTTMVAFTSEEAPERVIQRLTTLSALSNTDDDRIRRAHRDRERLAEQQAKLARAKKRAFAAEKNLADERKELNAALLEAARAQDQRGDDRASRASTRNGGACPVGDPVQISDTWGASRSGGRAHEGTDMLAPMGTPIYAVEDGTVSRAGTDGLGGVVIILKGESGDSYYYAHNRENLVGGGATVKAGQHIANVGMSGNAQGTVPHLHFERWPGGGEPVNPYPFVQTLCG